MLLCLATAMLAVGLGVERFSLQWTHSVEKTEWHETWRVTPDALTLVEARVRGSGAGMEPPDDARLQDGWWVYPGHVSTPALHLAASGATGRGWQLCTALGCRDLEDWLSLAGRAPENITLRPGNGCRPR